MTPALLNVGWIRPDGKFVPIEYTHSEVITNKDYTAWEAEHPALTEARRDDDDDDENGDIAQLVDESIAQFLIDKGWVRVQQKGFDARPEALVRQEHTIQDLVSRKLTLRDEIVFDVKRTRSYSTFRMTVAELYDGLLQDELRKDTERGHGPSYSEGVRRRSASPEVRVRFHLRRRLELQRLK